MPLALTAALGAGYALLAWLPAWRAEPLGFLALALLLHTGYAVAVMRWSDARGRRWTFLVLGAGVVFRLVILVGHPPDLSMDVARYAWDGHLASRGLNPFMWPPDHPELIELRTPEHALITYKDIPTIYPPLAQALFALGAVMGPGTGPIRLLLTFCDVLVMAGLALLLARSGLPPGRLLIYAWCPLPVLEVASSGHVEPLGTLCLLAAALTLAWRPAVAGAAWMGAVLVKTAPLLLAPLLVRRAGWRALPAAGLMAVALYLPFAGAGANLWRALGEYSSRWRHNESLFALAAGILPEGVARVVAAAAILAVLSWVAWRPSRAAHPGVGFLLDAARVMTFAVLVTPVLHPWYLLWLLPWLCLRPSPPWLLLCGTVLAAYLEGGLWAQEILGIALASWLVYFPPLLLGCWCWWRLGGGLLPAGCVDHPLGP